MSKFRKTTTELICLFGIGYGENKKAESSILVCLFFEEEKIASFSAVLLSKKVAALVKYRYVLIYFVKICELTNICSSQPGEKI